MGEAMRRHARFPILVTIGLGILAVSVLAGPREDRDFTSGPHGKAVARVVQHAGSMGFSGAVLAARDGKVVAAVAVGCADLAGERPITPATLFEIASTTKQFTACAVMVLVEEGKIDLDASIAKYLPGIPEDCVPIAVKHLLHNTSGIPGTNSTGGGDDVTRVIPLFLAGGPRHPPGEHYEYWNQGWALLSEIIARASKKPYVAFCKERLFAPAGMKASCFTGDAAPPGAIAAVGRSGRGQPRSALDHPYGMYGLQYRGMGGAVTSVWDLWRWDRALKGAKILSDRAKAEMFRPGLENYAMGWFVAKNKAGRLVQSHTGGVRGFCSDFRRYPGQDGCLFVLCNDDRVRVTTVAQAAEEALFGDDPTIDPFPAPVPETTVPSLVGTYTDPHGRRLVVASRDGVVTADIHWSASGPVTNGFLGLGSEGSLVFHDGNKALPVEIEGPPGKPASKIALDRLAFQRVEPGASPSPAPVPAALLARIRGSYRNDRGHRLEIRVEGDSARAELHWSERGPVTRATVILGEDGNLVFHDGSASLPLIPSGPPGKPAKILLLDGIAFERTG